MKRKYLLIILISILLCMITIIITQKNYIINKVNSNISKKENQDILFEVYSNSDNILKFKITAIDEEQGINKFIYNLENGKEIQINTYNKKNISIPENTKKITWKYTDGDGAASYIYEIKML